MYLLCSASGCGEIWVERAANHKKPELSTSGTQQHTAPADLSESGDLSGKRRVLQNGRQ